MIIVHAMIPVREDQRDQALEMARTMADATQAEPGCVSYEFYIGLRDPNTLMLFQEWEDMDALMGHFQTEHMETFLRDLPSVTSGEISTRRYAVQSVDQTEDGDDEHNAPRVVH